MAEPLTGIAAIQAATKTAFKTMMDAATKAGALSSQLADAAPTPDEALLWHAKAKAWQNVSHEAYKNWSQL